MPMSKGLARFNRVVTNRTLGRIAPWMPGFGVVHHRGRKSGRDYRTPVNVFRRGDGYVMAMTYGSQTDWVKNVLAAGGCDLETRRHLVHLVEPRLYVDEKRTGMPAFVRTVLGLTNVTEFLALKLADESSPR
ncbi:MAG: nitroreductase family deazaflavin-dependent oxidoreductase [Streptosporangiales bacterium]|nr:nitroreductase family deazaflavin-dependent oxidoreductase [Streptosporangiales bacterium]